MDLNRRPLELEATALPTEPQRLSGLNHFISLLVDLFLGSFSLGSKCVVLRICTQRSVCTFHISTTSKRQPSIFTSPISWLVFNSEQSHP